MLDIPGSSSLYEECIKRCNQICLQLYEKDVASPATVAVSIISRQYFSSKAYKGSIDDKSEVKLLNVSDILYLLQCFGLDMLLNIRRTSNFGELCMHCASGGMLLYVSLFSHLLSA